MESSLSAETWGGKKKTWHQTKCEIHNHYLISHSSVPPFSLSCFFVLPHLRELAVSKPLQPPHAMAGLPFAGGAPSHHDAGPPGKSLDLPPHQLADAKTLVVLNG